MHAYVLACLLAHTQRGVIPRMIQHLFSEIQTFRDRSCKVSIQYLEIYNGAEVRAPGRPARGSFDTAACACCTESGEALLLAELRVVKRFCLLN
eukprot:366319-Chlamydomonas_euryale.AAC.11